MVSKESSGAVLMKFTATYTKTATDHVTKMALGMAIAQYLQRERDEKQHERDKNKAAPSPPHEMECHSF